MVKSIYVLKHIINNYFKHNVSKNAAALAYYLIFAIFPLLIFISNLLGWLQLDAYYIAKRLSVFLPQEITSLVLTYLQHINDNFSPYLLWFSLVFSVWFPYRAVKGLVKDVRTAYELPYIHRQWLFTVSQLIYTVLLLFVFAVTMAVSIMGESFLLYIFRIIPVEIADILKFLLPVWKYTRFVLAGLAMYIAIFALYAVALWKKPSTSEVLPGMTASLAIWLIVSVAFSFYVENFAGYSVIYGTLGAVMALLIWLYLSAIILIMGAELNAILINMKKELK